MSAITPILRRLETGRPLILSSDPVGAAARVAASGGAASFGKVLRETPAVVTAAYEIELAAGADVLVALTGETMPRALATAGMAFRAAALTAKAVDLAEEAAQTASRQVGVAGMLGWPGLSSVPFDRLGEEYTAHAARLAASGCALALALGVDHASSASTARSAAVLSAARAGLPAWLLVDCDAFATKPDGEPIESCAQKAIENGAQAILLHASSVEVALLALGRALSVLGEDRVGMLLAARTEGSLAEGAADPWFADAKRLVDAGARVIGGGRGTTAKHTAGLALSLGRSNRGSIWPRAV